jgi:predicted dehydrogenase
LTRSDRFHPAIQRVKAIIDSGELGAIKEVNAALAVPKGLFGEGDIRMDYDLGGGAMMDCGCQFTLRLRSNPSYIFAQGYPLSCVRYLASSNPNAVTSATAVRFPKDPRIDIGTVAELTFPSSNPGGNPMKSTIKCSLSNSPRWGFIPKPEIQTSAVCEGGTIEMFNFVMPVIYHYITVKPNGSVPRTEKVYAFKGDNGKGEEWWTTYRYQLEAFVDKIKGRTPQTWMSAEDSIANMEWIERIYEEASPLTISE